MNKLGIDLGSSYTKGVLVDENNKIVDYHVSKTGFDFIKAAQKIIDKFSSNHEIQYPVFTCGYGRDQLLVPYVSNSEIIALSRTVFDSYNRKCSVIDIGGQDTKYIKINDQGQVDKFKMNRKCAAGTGSFIEEIAFRLDVSAVEFNNLVKQATEEVKINSFCTVFAISEIIGMIKNGFALPNIILGIYNSVVERCVEMSPLEDYLIITGGVPDNHPEIIRLFKNRFNNCDSPEKSQFMAAYGCVLLNNET
ncbi:MAG: ATPase [Bacteroidetes bacterium]|nr:ATPase [Bacteroidota bacterium]MBL6944673.1 ATPase [Bacteroidales bacterium]